MKESSTDESLHSALPRKSSMVDTPANPVAGQTSISQRLKVAAQLAAKKAERARLKSATLPGAYEKLGRHLQQTAVYKDIFVDLFHQLKDVETQISALAETSANRPTATGLANKMKSTVAAARQMAVKKGCQRRIDLLLTMLGEAAYEKYGNQSGPDEIITPIIQIRSRVAQLDAHIEDLSKPIGQHEVSTASGKSLVSNGQPIVAKKLAANAAGRTSHQSKTNDTEAQVVTCPYCQHKSSADVTKRIRCLSCGKGWFPWEINGSVTLVNGEEDMAAGLELALAALPAGITSFAVNDTDTFIGRAADNDVALDNLMVSRRHVRLRRAGASIYADDMGATNGTYLNGHRLLKSQVMTDGDVLTVGPYCLVLADFRLTMERPEVGAEIVVRGLCQEVIDRQSGRPRMLLNDISLTIRPGEFVGLLGTSGAGKSTFVGAVSGRRPGTHGEVLFNGENLYSQFDAFKAGIGFVPQDVIFHDSLPLTEALGYTSRLRLSKDASRKEINANIDRVLKIVGLAEQGSTIIRNLSGGQKKRVSIAMELLSRPRILFLDEVTSGLDPRTEKQMMKLFRELADSGITVICITHYANSAAICDQIAYLNAGLLMFYGPPTRFKSYFDVEQVEAAYDREDEKTPLQWCSDFKQSASYHEIVAMRGETGTGQRRSQARINRVQGIDWPQLRRQLRVLTFRYIRVVSIDRRNLLLLLALPPLTAILLCILSASMEVLSSIANYSDYSIWWRKQNILCFGPIIIMFLLSMFGAVREIVKELSIYQHERFINLRIVPYLLSKIGPLSIIGAVQTLSVVLIIGCFADIQAGSLFVQFFILFLISTCGMLAGLAISASVKSSDWAVLLMIGAVIPQILFAGGLVPVQGASAFIGKGFVSAYWALEGLKSQVEQHYVSHHVGTYALTPKSLEWEVSAVMLLLHITVLALIVFIFMARKDGPGAVGRIRRSIALLRRPHTDDTRQNASRSDPVSISV